MLGWVQIVGEASAAANLLQLEFVSQLPSDEVLLGASRYCSSLFMACLLLLGRQVMQQCDCGRQLSCVARPKVRCLTCFLQETAALQERLPDEMMTIAPALPWFTALTDVTMDGHAVEVGSDTPTWSASDKPMAAVEALASLPALKRRKSRTKPGQGLNQTRANSDTKPRHTWSRSAQNPAKSGIFPRTSHPVLPPSSPQPWQTCMHVIAELGRYPVWLSYH